MVFLAVNHHFSGFQKQNGFGSGSMGSSNSHLTFDNVYSKNSLTLIK